MRTDKERIEFLEQLNSEGDYTGRCILRNSATGRGWRLHETGRTDAHKTVREAIDAMMEADEDA